MSEMDMEDEDYKKKVLRFEYSTPALIEELGKRRPCDICEAWMVDARPCKNCLWQVSRIFGGKVDNFKPAK